MADIIGEQYLTGVSPRNIADALLAHLRHRGVVGGGNMPVVRASVPTERYLLKADFQDEWQEVTRNAWIKAERAAGFRPKCASTDPKFMTTPATSEWSGSGVSERIERIS